MNVTSLIVDRLDWDGQIKTLTFRPKDGADLWVARFDEYLDPRSGPFYILEPEQEREFARKFQRAPSRRPSRYEELGGGAVRFPTEWLGIATEGGSQFSWYAFCLPEDGVPDAIEFSDPRSGRKYSYDAGYDNQTGRIVCYLECRSKYGSFDFDLTMTLHRDAEACRSFVPVTATPNTLVREMSDLLEATDVVASTKARIVIQQFFRGDQNITMSAGIGERAKSSTWVKIFGFITLAAAVTATVLLITKVTDIGIAGYAVALISLFVAIIPLFRK